MQDRRAEGSLQPAGDCEQHRTATQRASHARSGASQIMSRDEGPFMDSVTHDEGESEVRRRKCSSAKYIEKNNVK